MMEVGNIKICRWKARNSPVAASRTNLPQEKKSLAFKAFSWPNLAIHWGSIRDRFSLCSPSWSWVCGKPASVSQVLGLQVWSTIPVGILFPSWPVGPQPERGKRLLGQQSFICGSWVETALQETDAGESTQFYFRVWGKDRIGEPGDKP